MSKNTQDELGVGTTSDHRRVVVVGGGLAGLSAAATLAESGFAVDVIESRRNCGGRAASFEDPQDGSLVDACQHVAMGCCTNFLDLCRRAGFGSELRRDRTLWFIGPDGTRSACTPAGWLPAPLHLLPLLFGMSHFSVWEKLSLSYGMMRLAVRQNIVTDDSEPTAACWLQSRQPKRVIDLFWQPVIESALGESMDFVGISAVRKVVVDGFLAHPQAADLLVPTEPLGKLFGSKLVSWLRNQGVVVHTGRTVTGIQYDNSHDVTGVYCGEDVMLADAVILAVPWRAAARLVPDVLPPVDESFIGSPITAVHLWFDRQIFDLPHAVLVGRVSQWVFQGEEEVMQAEEKKSARKGEEIGYHCQVVISASRGLCDGNREQLLETVVAELRDIFPEAQAAQLIRSRVVTDPTAVLSVRPGIDTVRPKAKTPVKNLFLAGDWTQTGWPSTMEGAVRSGRHAAAMLIESMNGTDPPLVNDLRKNPVIRLLVGG
jgi:squalene-associated FAD-dependent desaturase